MKLWKVWIESVRHLADCGREPGCHFTPGCIGNRTHCPFSSRIWWILVCQSMNQAFEADRGSIRRWRIVRGHDGVSIPRGIQRADCWKTWWCWSLWGFDVRCVILKFWHECFVMIFWCIVPGGSWVCGIEAAKCQVLRDFGCHHSASIP